MTQWTELEPIEDALSRKYTKYPHFQVTLRKAVEERAAGSSLYDAWQWFLEFENRYLHLPVFPLNIDSNDQAVKDTAEAMAGKCRRMFEGEIGNLKANGVPVDRRIAAALEIIENAINTWHLSHPIKAAHPTEGDVVAGMARMSAAKWWRRQLRVQQGRHLENAARVLGLICRRRGGYCSFATLTRRKFQKARNRHLLENLLAENDEGDIYTLAELSDLGVSNPANRRAELMTRISGFEKLADADGDVDWRPVFYTLTCPSKFHSHNRGGIRNPKWNESSPRDAQDHLRQVWSKTRAAWDKHDIRVFGFRIAEPHHDACPHWHILLWIPKGRQELASRLFRQYALEVDGAEKGADKRRLKVDIITADNGQSATGYVAKYVSKNVDGLTDEGEAWSGDSVRTALRVEAWASTWGIRQFQQIGGASVTVWRELRRLVDSESTHLIEQIRKAADAGDWDEFTRLMGGPTVRRAHQPLRALMLAAKGKINDYGEKVKSLWGLMIYQVEKVAGGVVEMIYRGDVQTRVREWAIHRKEDFFGREPKATALSGP